MSLSLQSHDTQWMVRRPEAMRALLAAGEPFRYADVAEEIDWQTFTAARERGVIVATDQVREGTSGPVATYRVHDGVREIFAVERGEEA
ncbi:MAG: hypothetical protein ACOCR0_03445 [Haloferacaceae archaeon]